MEGLHSVSFQAFSLLFSSFQCSVSFFTNLVTCIYFFLLGLLMVLSITEVSVFLSIQSILKSYVPSTVKLQLTQNPLLPSSATLHLTPVLSVTHRSFYSQLYLFLYPTQGCELHCLCLLSFKPKALSKVVVH